MKYLIFLLFVTTSLAFGQDTEKREYAGGVLQVGDGSLLGDKFSDTLLINDRYLSASMNKNWKVKFQDDSTYKSMVFDDRLWDSTNIDKFYKNIPSLNSDKIAWFRKALHVDSAMLRVPLLFDIKAAGAWEFYIDGKLQGSFGEVNIDSSVTLVNMTAQRLPYSFEKSGTHQLAFRFLYDATAQTDKEIDMSPLRLVIRRSDQQSIAKDKFDIKGATGIVAGLFLLAAIIHWFFYFQFKTDKRDTFNLFLSVSMLCFACFSYISSPSLKTFSLDWFVARELMEGFLFVVGHCLLLIAVHKYLSQKNYVLLWIVVGVMFVSGFLANFVLEDPYSNYSDLASVLLTLGVYIYMVIKAKRQKIKSSKTLLNALLYFLVVIAIAIALLVVVSIVSMFYTLNLQSNVLTLMSFFLIIILAGPQLAVSFAISSDLAKEFVSTNKTLSKKVQEIELLSNEKEEIMKVQNEKLEELVNKRTAELNKTVSNLKSTQDQLVQSEKLASLGELTAGIAHEIQNPLNFVNNFSEVSEELIEELAEERKRKPEERDKELEDEIIDDLKGNLKKISHHGNRASGIVKSMLEHSRVSDGHKEPTNINALADEYLRLAYHGLRAKDRSFNAKLETNFDEALPKVNVISQDIGRVFLNIINNAFQSPPPTNATEDYMKMVTITTEHNTDSVKILIKDNGAGIPDEIKDKIFQPFFTTKDTGQGTGLGLSLTHDIIKAHGGTITVKSKENAGTTFIITLPNTI